MKPPAHTRLSRRERQIMDVIYERGHATAAEVQESLPDAPSYSAVRALLRVLEEKGHLRHEQDGPRYVFHAVIERERAQESALRHLLRTFFNGSVEEAVATMIDVSRDEITEEQFDELARLIENARKEGR